MSLNHAVEFGKYCSQKPVSKVSELMHYSILSVWKASAFRIVGKSFTSMVAMPHPKDHALGNF